MGVTTHWFAFDPAVFAEPTVDALLAAGHLDDELEVTPHLAGLVAVPSWLEDNKRWYRNLDADSAWSGARQVMSTEARAPYDRWFAHLFWDPPAALGGDPVRAPHPVADGQVIYPAGLLRHILDLERPLDPVGAALRRVFADGPPPLAGYPWMYTADGFAALVGGWQSTFERVARDHPGWSLLRWVWV